VLYISPLICTRGPGRVMGLTHQWKDTCKIRGIMGSGAVFRRTGATNVVSILSIYLYKKFALKMFLVWNFDGISCTTCINTAAAFCSMPESCRRKELGLNNVVGYKSDQTATCADMCKICVVNGALRLTFLAVIRQCYINWCFTYLLTYLLT